MEFLNEYHLSGLFIGICTFLIIGLFHPVVVKAEYYWGTKCWWIFLVLGIGGVSTFKSSHLREDLPAVVPMNRIVLETDSPYMAPVPYRGKRNESAFVVEVMKTLAKAYGVSEEEFARQTNINAERVFPLSVSLV